MVILTLNCGSSSVKYQVYDWRQSSILASGIVERVGLGDSVINHKAPGIGDFSNQHECPSHTVAIELIMRTLTDPKTGVIKDMKDIAAVGHRMVHGGMKFARSVLIDDESLATFKELIDLAPLHNPANIMGVEAAREVLPAVPHSATMDTAWHQTMPETSFLYALPRDWYEQHMVRRYGFHGTSFLYTAKRAAVLLGKNPFETNLIIAHIGNGSSINAVRNGCSFDTSMGMTPLEGLVMGTRSGDIDAGIVFHMIRKAGLTPVEVENKLNKASGVLGITKRWTDRRDIENAAEEGNKLAQLAQEIEGYRIKKYIGAYSAALGRVDALVFTAGVGEMGPVTRSLAASGLENMGIIIDQDKNTKAKCRNAELEISAAHSPVKVYVIPTDEELVMTEDAYALMNGSYDLHTSYTYCFQDPAYINKQRAAGLENDLKKKPYLAGLIAKPR
jgi:acetate kinase